MCAAARGRRDFPGQGSLSNAFKPPPWDHVVPLLPRPAPFSPSPMAASPACALEHVHERVAGERGCCVHPSLAHSGVPAGGLAPVTSLSRLWLEGLPLPHAHLCAVSMSTVSLPPPSWTPAASAPPHHEGSRAHAAGVQASRHKGARARGDGDRGPSCTRVLKTRVTCTPGAAGRRGFPGSWTRIALFFFNVLIF